MTPLQHLLKHVGYEVSGEERGGVAAIKVMDGPVDYYLTRGWISRRQHDAAQEFYRCW